MVNTDVLFYDIPVPEDLPPHLEVGALYWIRSTGAVRINHGNEVVQYGGFSGPQGEPGPEGINWKGQYVHGTTYHLRDTVEYMGNAWIVKVDTVVNVTPPQRAEETNENWDLLAKSGGVGQKGEPGVPGPQGNPGMVWRGPWGVSVSYRLHDCVQFLGNSWIAIQAHIGHEPPTTAEGENAWWQLFVRSGQDGTGIGDMVKASYDSDGDGIVNAADYATTAGTATAAIKADLADMALDTPWKVNHETDIATNKTNIAMATASVVAEAIARAEADALLNDRIDAAVGKLRYLPTYNFGTPLPTQEALTNYAKSHTGLDHVENATSVVNSYDSHEWVYNDGLSEWVDLGLNNVTLATNKSAGIVMGSTATGMVGINPDGTMKVTDLTGVAISALNSTWKPLAADNPVADKAYVDSKTALATNTTPGLVMGSTATGYIEVVERGQLKVAGLDQAHVMGILNSVNPISEANPVVDKAYFDGVIASLPSASMGGGWDSYKVFTESTTWVSNINGTVLGIAIAGGGGGGSYDVAAGGGGGGAGGVHRFFVPLRKNMTVDIVVGKGGAAGVLSGSSASMVGKGGEGSWLSIAGEAVLAAGGGGGGGRAGGVNPGGGGGGGGFGRATPSTSMSGQDGYSANTSGGSGGGAWSRGVGGIRGFPGMHGCGATGGYRGVEDEWKGHAIGGNTTGVSRMLGLEYGRGGRGGGGYNAPEFDQEPGEPGAVILVYARSQVI
jgi:hypothetical protein